MPAVRGSSRRRSRLSDPAVRGSWRRRSRPSHPAVRGSSRRRSWINQPTVRRRWRRRPRLTLAHRPAAESMPTGLPLTQCPPACLWLKPAGSPLTQARWITADSSSPDCHWLMPAGRRSRGKLIHHALSITPPSAAHRPHRSREITPPSVGKANPPSAAPSSSRGRPTRRPRSLGPPPAVASSSLPLSGQASRLWSRQPTVAVFDQTVTKVFLSHCFLCV